MLLLLVTTYRPPKMNKCLSSFSTLAILICLLLSFSKCENGVAKHHNTSASELSFIGNSADGILNEAITIPKDGEPLKLIYPSDDRKTLLINATTFQSLINMPSPLGVLSIVGPLHSGKSFFLNQLLNRTSGFELGPTTKPATKGIWIWSKPIEICYQKSTPDIYLGHQGQSPSSNLRTTYILLVDTEGMFSHDSNELYDAKTFAIATLITSTLVYNSVKLIDQSGIDALHLLIHRTRLFHARASLETSEPEMIKTYYKPNLVWIIQDFIQEIDNGMSPTDWLESLLQRPSTRRHSSLNTSESNIRQMFGALNCYTLSLPQYEPEKLKRLDSIFSEDLLEDYREQMRVVQEDLLINMSCKPQVNNTCDDGIMLGKLIKVLVRAANSDVFPEIPSVWSIFTELQTRNAIQDAHQYFVQTIKNKIASYTDDVLLAELSNSNALSECTPSDSESRLFFSLNEALIPTQIDKMPMPSNQLQLAYIEISERAQDIFDSIVSGLYSESKDNDIFERQKDQLHHSMEMSYAAYQEINEQHIANLCQRIISYINEELDRLRETIRLPLCMAELTRISDDWIKRAMTTFDFLTRNYHQFEKQKEQLEQGLYRGFANIMNRNIILFEEKIEEDVSQHAQHFDAKVKHEIFNQSRANPLPASELCFCFEKYVPDANVIRIEDNRDFQGTISIKTLKKILSDAENLIIDKWTKYLMVSNTFEHVDIKNSKWLALSAYSKRLASQDQYMKLIKAKIDPLSAIIIEEQHKKIEIVRQEILMYFLQRTTEIDRMLDLPIRNEDLDHLVNCVCNKLIQMYELSLQNISSISSIVSGSKRLRQSCDDEHKELTRRNSRKLNTILASTLPLSTDLLERRIAEFWLPNSASRFAHNWVAEYLRRNQRIENQTSQELARLFVEQNLKPNIQRLKIRIIALLVVAIVPFVCLIIIKKYG